MEITRTPWRRTSAATAVSSLAHGCAIEAELVTAARRVPASLLHCQLLFAPARMLEPSVERLDARRKGTFLAVQLADAPDVGWNWEVAARKVPDVARALRNLNLRPREIDHAHGIDMGR